MRKFILALTLMTFGLAHGAEFLSEKTIVCDNSKRIYEYFTSEPYNEVPMWMGKDILESAIQYTLFANPKTGTWTMVMTKDDVGCVLGAGTKHTLIVTNLGERT